MTYYVFAIYLCLMVTPLHADIYQWIDSKGQTHYSDTPQKGATVVDLKPTQTYSLKVPVIISKESTVSRTAYKLEIIQPKQNATIRNPEGHLSVIIEVTPSLKEGETLQLLVNNVLYGSPQHSRHFKLEHILRGAHTLEVQRLNRDGQSILSSQPITIYMMPPTIRIRH